MHQAGRRPISRAESEYEEIGPARDRIGSINHHHPHRHPPHHPHRHHHHVTAQEEEATWPPRRLPRRATSVATPTPLSFAGLENHDHDHDDYNYDDYDFICFQRVPGSELLRCLRRNVSFQQIKEKEI